jgi:hypothetical protein
MISLHDVAPRLARARDQHVAEVRERAQRRAEAETLRVNLDRLVAHRELQLLRAGATNDREYVARRSRKLAAAQRARARLEDALREMSREARVAKRRRAA